MNKYKLTKLHEKIFDICINISYILLIISALGLSQKTPTYLQSLDYYIRVYTCLLLIWRFNPFRSYYEFTTLDRKIAFSAGLFILTTTVINQYTDYIKNKVGNFLNISI